MLPATDLLVEGDTKPHLLLIMLSGWLGSGSLRGCMHVDAVFFDALYELLQFLQGGTQQT